MSLGTDAYRVGGAWQCSSMRKELLQQHFPKNCKQASNCVYKSQGALTRALGHPSIEE